MHILLDPVIPNLEIYPTNRVPSFFEIAKYWKQSQCPSMADWFNKLWCIHKMEYYGAIKKKSHTKEWKISLWKEMSEKS